MVILANRLAIECPTLRTDIVEISEFPFLMQKYSIMGVPKTIINEKTSIEGLVSEDVFLNKVIQAINTMLNTDLI